MDVHICPTEVSEKMVPHHYAIRLGSTAQYLIEP